MGVQLQLPLCRTLTQKGYYPTPTKQDGDTEVFHRTANFLPKLCNIPTVSTHLMCRIFNKLQKQSHPFLQSG